MRALDMVLSRRQAMVAGLGVAASAVAAACGIDRTASSSPSPSTTASPSGVPLATPVCIVTPSETEGPYFVDERLNRSDIRVDPSDGTVRQGVPLTLTFTVARAGAQCTALQGAQVDVWHCDANGLYSDVASEGSAGKRFLRGYQLTDANGAATFTTVYPGWYRGRAVHIHFKVRTFSGSNKTLEFTSQIFFDDSVSDEVFRQSPYSGRGTRDTRNTNDMVFTSNGNSGARLLADVTQSGSGYRATFAIGLTAS